MTDGEGDPYVLALSGESPQSIVFTDPDGSPAQLDKYDPEGYRYLYVVREYLDATAAAGRPADSYEQVLGTVNADGSVTIPEVLVPYMHGVTKITKENAVPFRNKK